MAARSLVFFTKMKFFMYKGTIAKYATIPHKDNVILISYECRMSLIGRIGIQQVLVVNKEVFAKGRIATATPKLDLSTRKVTARPQLILIEGSIQ